jgi:hypothetical protein
MKETIRLRLLHIGLLALLLAITLAWVFAWRVMLRLTAVSVSIAIMWTFYMVWQKHNERRAVLSLVSADLRESGGDEAQREPLRGAVHQRADHQRDEV